MTVQDQVNLILQVLVATRMMTASHCSRQAQLDNANVVVVTIVTIFGCYNCLQLVKKTAHGSRQAELDNAKGVTGNSLPTSFPPVHPFA